MTQVAPLSFRTKKEREGEREREMMMMMKCALPLVIVVFVVGSVVLLDASLLQRFDDH